jgi:hypothetical protein
MQCSPQLTPAAGAVVIAEQRAETVQAGPLLRAALYFAHGFRLWIRQIQSGCQSRMQCSNCFILRHRVTQTSADARAYAFALLVVLGQRVLDHERRNSRRPCL